MVLQEACKGSDAEQITVATVGLLSAIDRYVSDSDALEVNQLDEHQLC